MKKILFLIFSLLMYINVQASSVNYNITNFLIDANILENGNLEMKELIVLDGTFHGYVRELEYKNPKLSDYTPGEINFANSAIYNAKGISNVKVSTRNVTNEEITFETFQKIFTPLTRALNEKIAKDGNFIYHNEEDILSYKMYQSAEDEAIAFFVSYIVEDAVVIHEDVAELYWNFIGTGFTDKISNLQIKLHLPKEDNTDAFHGWAHGDITGEIDFVDQKTILAQMKSLDKNTVVDIRTTFDKSLIHSNTLRHSNEMALEEILKIEEKRAEDANKQREFIRTVRKITKGMTYIYYVILIILWFYVYFKFDREYKSEFNSKYYREFTGSYSVEVIDYLMNKNITPNAMSASIMNLIYKKNIEVTEIPSEKKKKYKFILKNNDKVTDTEQILLDFLFEKVGKENTFTTNDLEKYAKSSRTCESFSKNYNEWKNCVIKDAEREKFYETNGIPIVTGILVLLISILIFLVVMYYHIDLISSYFLLPVGILFLFYTILIKKRTKKGNEDYLRWKAFKNFLNDFGNFKIKELPEIALWEKYLIYATIFGLADKVEKSMNVKISEYQNVSSTYTTQWNPLYDWNLYHIINRSVHTAFTSNMTANQANANSRNSSGGGFGGGFSSGSGFGGGGGGGHGF